MASFMTIPLYKLLCNISTTSLSKVFYNMELCSYNDVQIRTNILSFYNSEYLLYNSYTMDFVPLRSILYGYSTVTDIVSHKICNIINHYSIHIDLHIFYEIRFCLRVSNISPLEFQFQSLQDHIIMIPGETGLIFFRLHNPTQYDITGISLYSVYPTQFSIYLQKIQCFCFDELLIRSHETIELPVLFYLDKLLLLDNKISEKIIYLSYTLFRD